MGAALGLRPFFSEDCPIFDKAPNSTKKKIGIGFDGEYVIRIWQQG